MSLLGSDAATSFDGDAASVISQFGKRGAKGPDSTSSALNQRKSEIQKRNTTIGKSPGHVQQKWDKILPILS